MDNYQIRKQSLVDWPKKNLFRDYTKFAKAGFRYKRNVLQLGSDVLHCDCCALSIGGWGANDNPYLEHAKHSPTCIHLLSVKGRQWIRGHVPPRIIRGDDGNGLQPLIRQVDHTVFRNQSAVITHNVEEYTTPIYGYRFRPPVIQTYTGYDERYLSVCTFRGIIKPEKWASAGFFVPDGEFHMQCYYCTLKVSQFDADDDPFIIHAKLYGWCFHLILEKGEPFVKIHNGERSLGRNETSVQEENININENGRMFNCRECGNLGNLTSMIFCLKCKIPVCAAEDCIIKGCCTEQKCYCRKCKRWRSLFDFVCCIRCRCMVCSMEDCLQSRCCDWPRP